MQTDAKRFSDHDTVDYCYTVQAWIVAGKVHPCGHRQPSPGCYACAHAGEPHAYCGDGCQR